MVSESVHNIPKGDGELEIGKEKKWQIKNIHIHKLQPTINKHKIECSWKQLSYSFAMCHLKRGYIIYQLNEENHNLKTEYKYSALTTNLSWLCHNSYSRLLNNWIHNIIEIKLDETEYQQQ